MIHDLDATLRALITQRAPSDSLLSHLSPSAIRFEIPDAAWRAQREGLTLSCYLFRVEQNRQMQTAEPLRRGDALRGGRLRAPVRVDCTYCVSAWGADSEEGLFEEHRLIGELLLLLLLYPVLPAEVLQGSLSTGIPPLLSALASAEHAPPAVDFWTALGHGPRPAIHVVLTLALQPDARQEESLASERVETIHIESSLKED